MLALYTQYFPEFPSRKDINIFQNIKSCLLTLFLITNQITFLNVNFFNEGQKKASAKPSGIKSLQLPKILQPERPQSSKIVTRFKTLDPHEARVQFVKEGMNTKDQYKMPRKHDFRGVSNF